QVSVNQEDVKSLLVPVPEIGEQAEVVQLVMEQLSTHRNLMKIRERLQAEIIDAATLFYSGNAP
ncbi:MAG TPA: hypothetical protein VKF15_02700, partial [Nitrososphaerales archaeon]|nr:hypothetical protein [Nitrososphaerales archaeon]